MPIGISRLPDSVAGLRRPGFRPNRGGDGVTLVSTILGSLIVVLLVLLPVLLRLQRAGWDDPEHPCNRRGAQARSTTF